MTDDKKIEAIKGSIKFVENALKDSDRNCIAAQITKAAGYENIRHIIDENTGKKFPRWFDNADSYICSECGWESKYPDKQCPNCKAMMINGGDPKLNCSAKAAGNKGYFEELGYFQKTAHLLELARENPELPLLVMAGEDANIGDYCMMTCSSVSCYVGRVLDYEYGERIFTDEDDFRDQFEDDNWDDWLAANSNVPEEDRDREYQEYISEKIKAYDKYWKDCIILEVDN